MHTTAKADVRVSDIITGLYVKNKHSADPNVTGRRVHIHVDVSYKVQRAANSTDVFVRSFDHVVYRLTHAWIQVASKINNTGHVGTHRCAGKLSQTFSVHTATHYRESCAQGKDYRPLWLNTYFQKKKTQKLFSVFFFTTLLCRWWCYIRLISLLCIHHTLPEHYVKKIYIFNGVCSPLSADWPAASSSLTVCLWLFTSDASLMTELLLNTFNLYLVTSQVLHFSDCVCLQPKDIHATNALLVLCLDVW